MQGAAEIADIEKYSNSVNKNLLEDLCKQSMVVLKDKLARKYEGNSSRKTFSEDNLWKEPYDVMAEYPVILSTTFSSRNSLNSDVVFFVQRKPLYRLTGGLDVRKASGCLLQYYEGTFFCAWSR